MAWILTVFILLFVLLSYLLFAPFYFEIDSTSRLLRIRFHRLASIRILFVRDSLVSEIKLPGWKKNFDLLALPERKRKGNREEKRKRKKFPLSANKIITILGSFRIKKCYVDMDFEDVRLNGILFPVFFWLGRLTGRKIAVNFLGRQDIQLAIENNLARVIWAYLYH
jgi:hypothetical protein